MRVLLALCLFLPQQQEEVDKAGAALTKALTALDRFGVDRALLSLVKLNHEKAPEILVAAFRAGVAQIAELEKERQRILKEMEKVEVTRDKDGRIVKGDLNKWQFLKRDHDVVAAKIDVLNGATPRIAGQMGSLTTTKAII